MANKIESWSFSRYKDYETCPAKARYKHVLKMKEPSSPAMERGTAIHKMAEDFITGDTTALPAELASFQNSLEYLQDLRRLEGSGALTVEENWSFKKDWTATSWNDWAGCWLRVKIDCTFTVEAGVLRIIDWKTGKMRDDEVSWYLLQLELYALAAFFTMPDIHTVIPKLAFIDLGITYPLEDKVYKRPEKEKLRKTWERRIAPMMNDTTFLPKPGAGCRFCYFRKSNQGPCKY